ncbi:MAG: hypothetical protein IPJ37_13525 [Bacteroidales bacterium]|nr:hypothetical protein [Bacteroidales bacterium]
MKTIILKLLTLFVLFLSGCSGNEQQIRVKFDGSYPEKRWSIKELNPDMPSDWSGSRFITFEFNSSTTHRFDLNIYDAGGVRSLEIVPFQNVWVRASIPLIHFQKMNTEGMDQASIWKTPRPGYWIGFTGAVGSINNIDSLGVAMNMPIGSPTLEIRNFRLTTTAEDTILTNKPLVDEFGQWISDEWQGKAKTIDDLKTAWSEEEKSLRLMIPEYQNTEVSRI